MATSSYYFRFKHQSWQRHPNIFVSKRQSEHRDPIITGSNISCAQLFNYFPLISELWEL
jgi:hypothetical protein